MTSDSTGIEMQVAAYLRTLGLTDATLISEVATDCLASARRRAAPGSEPELLRRALEEAQRRFNRALGQLMGLDKTGDDEQPLAAVRAAVLLGTPPIATDDLLCNPDASDERVEQIRRTLPVSTPPESPLDMHARPLRFWLFKS
jgi:hypothetical protein